MKKKQLPEEVLAAFIAANPQANKTAISEGTGLKGIALVNTLKKMVKAGGLTEEGTGKEAIYTVVEPAAEEPAETSNQLEIPVEDEQQASKTNGGKRNNDKYRFNNSEPLGKGALVREIIKDYVANHKKATLKQLDETWKPTELLKRFGIYAEIGQARNLSGARDRYFFQEEHEIRLADKKVIVVSNQQTNSTLQSFIKVAKSLSYKISVAK